MPVTLQPPAKGATSPTIGISVVDSFTKPFNIDIDLTDVIGPRLSGSPSARKANEWTRDQLTAMGLSNAHLEPWGPFGRGWANQYVNARMTSPVDSFHESRSGAPA